MVTAIYREREALIKEKEFLEQKLNIHLDFWAADKWQLENLLFMAERGHNCKAVLQAYENAQLDLSLGSQQEELLLTNLRLESALDDVRNLQSRMDILGSQLQGEKENVELLRKQALIREAHMFEKEAEFASKLHEALEKHSLAEKKFQDVQQQLTKLHSNYKMEMDKEKTETELCKSKLAALLRERDFVWNQLKRMEADYCSQLKVREEQIQQAAAEIEKLRDSIDLMQRITDERAVELTILKMELKKAEDESRNTKLLAEGAKNSQLNRDPEGHLDRLQSQKLQAKEVQAFVFLEQDSTNVMNMAAAAETSDKEDELRNALKRLDEVRLENENLRVLYAELEARYNAQQKPDKLNRNGRKDTTTRNLNSELEAVAEGATKLKRSLSRKARSEDGAAKKKALVTKTNGTSRPVETSGKRHQGKRKLPSDHSTGYLSRKAKTMTALNERNSCSTEVEQGNSLVKTSFFSSAFSIPKVKGLASLR